MAEAAMSSPAVKILLPLTQENVEIVGLEKEPLPHMVRTVVEEKFRKAIGDADQRTPGTPDTRSKTIK